MKVVAVVAVSVREVGIWIMLYWRRVEGDGREVVVREVGRARGGEVGLGWLEVCLNGMRWKRMP